MSRTPGATSAATGIIALGVLVLLAAPATAAKLSCLTGTDPVVANDDPQIRAVQGDVDAACPCASYDGTKTKKHGDYVKCATGVVNDAAEAGNLRMQCKGTVKKFYAQSTCGFAAGAKVPCIKKTLSNGKVGCSIKATKSCVSMPGKTEQNACAGDTTCIAAADTNDDLRIGAPGDSGQCNPTSTCGDGVREGAEECDGTDLGGATCSTQGFVGGTLACSGGCAYDTSACIAGGGLTVQVLRPSGLPVTGAAVTVGTQNGTTGDDGTAAFSNVPPGRTVAKVEAAGFAPSTAVVDVVSNATTPATVSLLPLGDPIVFSADSGTTATRGGVQVTIPAGALVDGLGQPVTGAVSMTIAVLDPTTNQIALAPGPFLGIPDGGGDPVDFESILMAEISLTQGGAPLTLAPGQTATLDYTLPDALQGVFSDGQTIEAWFYDLDAGLWRQDGTGTIVRIGGVQHWIVTVSHFTWWNCDRPWTEKNCVEVTVTRDLNGELLSGVTVTASGETYFGTSFGQTDETGVACLDFKANSVVRVVAESLVHGVQVDGQRFVAGNLTPATCSGEGFGVCQEIAVELSGQTCVRGTVVGTDGTTPFEGANVHAVISSGYRQMGFETTTGSDGSYCLPAAIGTEVTIQVTATSGGDFLHASTTTTPSSGEAVCGQPGMCTQIGQLTLEEVEEDTCVRGRIFLQSSGGEQPHGDAGVPVYLYSDFPDVSCNPGEEDPATWGTLVAQGVTDANGYFCVPFSKLPWDFGGVESLTPRGSSGGEPTSTRYVVPGDCVTRMTYGSAGAFPRQIVEKVLNPNRSCEELNCIDAGDINMFFGGYGSDT